MELDQFLQRADALITRIEALLPPPPQATDWSAKAFRWRKRQNRGYLEAVRHPHRIRLDDLREVDEQKARLEQNTRQFVHGKPASPAALAKHRCLVFRMPSTGRPRAWEFVVEGVPTSAVPATAVKLTPLRLLVVVSSSLPTSVNAPTLFPV